MSMLNTVRKKQGMSPGSLIFTGKQKIEKIKIDIFQYNQGSITEKKIDKIEELKELINAESILWVNICGLHDVDKLEKVGEIFGIGLLELEDILNVIHSPKLEEQEEYVFMICKMLNYSNNIKKISVEQVSFILGKKYLITFQEKEGDDFNFVRERLRNGKGRLRKLGADYLMYRLLDSIVDNYAVILLELDERMENIEDELLDDPRRDTIENIYSFRKEVNKLRRSVVPLMEIIYTIEKDVHPLIHKSNLIFIRDLGDHIKGAIDTLENFREQVNSMIEIYRSTSGLKLNEIVKVLTIISTIFIPLTFIVGIYGMNFNPNTSPFNMPELNWYFGYPIVLILMVMIAVGLLIIFRKKKWL